MYKEISQLLFYTLLKDISLISQQPAIWQEETRQSQTGENHDYPHVVGKPSHTVGLALNSQQPHW